MPLSHQTRPVGHLKAIAGYAAMVLAAVGLFFLIRAYGETLPAPASSAGNAAAAGGKDTPLASHVLFHLLLALSAVIVAGQVLVRLLDFLGQPPVIGEVLAGICLGPSLLGRIWPEAGAYLLPPSVAPSLAIVAQLGVVLYMFVVGLELNAGILRKQGHATLVISHGSIILPFLLGALLAIWLYPGYSAGGYPFTSFALFLAVSMSITAFPVLARILTDRGIQRTALGSMALVCAATDDVTAWCLLALVVGVANARIDEALWVGVLTAGYVALMLAAVRPLATKIAPRFDERGLTAPVAALLFACLMLSAFTTEAIGVHAIFGGFLLGAVIPHDSRIAREMKQRLEGVVTALFLPAFFALTGMRTEISLVSGWQAWLVCLIIIAVATLGKFGGSLAAARLMGLSWNDSASLGVLMNTRGLMELIVLNIGLDLGIITPTLFAMMVIMALVTTLATSPLLRWLDSPTLAAARAEPAR